MFLQILINTYKHYEGFAYQFDTALKGGFGDTDRGTPNLQFSIL